MMKHEKKHKSLEDALSYFYISKIKRWMFCPSCREGRMTIQKKTGVWECKECRYELPIEEFKDDYVFWFCDECDAYLNEQGGFDKNASKHVCRNCGYENDTTFDNIKGVCVDCGGILIKDSDKSLCDDCKEVRKEKAKGWLATAGKVAGVAFVAVQTAVSVAQTIDGNDDSPANFTSKWLKKASIEELKGRRGLIEADYRNPGLDLDYRASLYDKLHFLDKIIGEREWAEAGKPEYRSPVPREHGWYLPSDD